jgi:branched-chain amino acid transport system permease protein
LLLQIVVNGLILAGSYALVAVGLTLIYGVMRMVNFAQGQFMMIGAFVAWTLTPYVGYLPAIAIAMVGAALLGIVVERIAFRPFRGVQLNGLIASMGISIMLTNMAELTWGTLPRMFQTPYAEMSIRIGTLGVSVQRVLVVLVSVVLLTGLWLVVQYTSMGKKIRAVAEDPEVAGAMGIDANRIAVRTFVLGSALAAAAGALNGPVTLLTPSMGSTEMLSAFAAIILGGFGNIQGTILGCLVIGMSQSLAASYIDNAYADSIAFVLMILVLVVFPKGLVPERSEENV